MRQINQINIYPNNELRIDWNFGNTCNYSCEYCPVELHNGSVPWASYEVITSFIDKLIAHFPDVKITVLFSGGEPTLYKDFAKVILYLYSKDITTQVISNGSRTIAWWKQNSQYVSQWYLTFHYGMAKLDHFKEVVGVLSEQNNVTVQIPMIPDKFEGCLAASDKILENSKNVVINFKPLLINFGQIMYKYSEEQLKIVGTYRISENYVPNDNRIIQKIYDDGAAVKTSAAAILTAQENNFFGWQCYAGVDLLSIHYDGSIFRGQCGVGGKIGNVSEEFEFPTEPIICNLQACSCLSDIRTRKRKI